MEQQVYGRPWRWIIVYIRAAWVGGPSLLKWKPSLTLHVRPSRYRRTLSRRKASLEVQGGEVILKPVDGDRAPRKVVTGRATMGASSSTQRPCAPPPPPERRPTARARPRWMWCVGALERRRIGETPRPSAGRHLAPCAVIRITSLSSRMPPGSTVRAGARRQTCPQSFLRSRAWPQVLSCDSARTVSTFALIVARGIRFSPARLLPSRIPQSRSSPALDITITHVVARLMRTTALTARSLWYKAQ